MALCSCGQRSSNAQPETVTEVKQATTTAPSFNADSAYAYIDRQVAFGYRVPNMPGHKACGDYLAAELKRFGAQVYEQEMTLTAYDGTKLDCRNIIGSFNPEQEKRILLFAHWDTRPYSDEDPNPANHRKPIDGADDGASGVGVLLEIARQIGMKTPNIGIDIAFFDAEDYGVPEFAKEQYGNTSDTWCLGSRFWGRNPHKPGYKAQFGILLDMVGARDAVFYKQVFHQRQRGRHHRRPRGGNRGDRHPLSRHHQLRPEHRGRLPCPLAYAERQHERYRPRRTEGSRTNGDGNHLCN